MRLLFAEPLAKLVFGEGHSGASSLAVEVCCHASLWVNECVFAQQEHQESCFWVSQRPLVEAICGHTNVRNRWDIYGCPFSKAEQMEGFGVVLQHGKERIGAG